MRGLTRATPRTALVTGSLAVTIAAAGLVVAGCTDSGDGVRMEGPARSDTRSAPPSTPKSASSAGTVDAIALLKADPEVDNELKANLRPCTKDEYPVDTDYGHLTRSTEPDIVVNVMTCADGIGIGSYVYREQGGSYHNVFSAEPAPAHIDVQGQELRVTRQTYRDGDAACCPSGEDVTTYRWQGDEFTSTGREHTDYSEPAARGDRRPRDDGTGG